MLGLGALAFLNPWLLAGLLALPGLWWLLRAIPPSPRRFRFPGVRLLLGLSDEERMPVRTPLWLLLLRCAIAAAAILAFAEPVLNPKARLTGAGPLLIVMDAGYASAPDWDARRARAIEALTQAERDGRAAMLLLAADPPPADAALRPAPAQSLRGAVEAALPRAWAPQRRVAAARMTAAQADEVLWITDGLAHETEGDAAFLAALAETPAVSVVTPSEAAPGLRAPALRDGRLTTDVLRADAGVESAYTVLALGSDETGAVRRLGQAQAVFEADALSAEAAFDLPLELRNRVEQLRLSGVDSAGAASLADEGVRRRRAGLVSGGADQASQRLVSDLHYLRAALTETAELVEGDIGAVLESRPDVIFLADVGRFTQAETEALIAWAEGGGMLVRFAGPRLARGADALSGAAIPADDPLLPVRLRAGGRAVGGAMAWGEPQGIRAFPETSPFTGLTPPPDVTVSRQLLAQIGPDLSERTWAALADGTPLVTAAPLGAGRVALFHVTANAEWSTLPLSGLFVEMTRRLVQLSGGAGVGAADRAALAGQTARPVALLDGFGRLVPAQAAGSPVARLDRAPGPDAPPGVYAVADTRLAYNIHGPDAALSRLASPGGAAVERLGLSEERSLAAWLLALAVLLLAVDTVATLALSGRLPKGPTQAAARTAGAVAMALALGALSPQPATAQTDGTPGRAALDTVFAAVRTGDAQVDALSVGGLRGLGAILTARTAIEPGAPALVDLETDDLTFYPILYWPITPSQPTPSDVAAAKLNSFMRTGGMIIFDTRDQHMSIGATAAANADVLRRLTAELDLPPLEPTPSDHVLTRAFYLLEEFPGRHAGGRVWVEAATDPDAEETLDGAPFRNLNDGVSPVIVGAADWAGAWAIDEAGQFMAPVAGSSGWRQREMAYRFGVNVAMYALTGNYKSDQVHVPALLERLGQ